VLIVVIVSWAILRAETVGAAATMVATMFGLRGLGHFTIANYLTWPVWVALLVAIIGAGPLIPWLSRWRVSVDALTASLVMMGTSVFVFVWRGSVALVRVFSPATSDRTKRK
ncbi:MAG TPA: hypothetical protein VF456_17355, partial [Vicinamibacterales bacterium]